MDELRVHHQGTKDTKEKLKEGTKIQKKVTKVDGSRAGRSEGMAKAGIEAVPERANEVARIVVDAALRVHRELGPGLLESVYEVCLCEELRDRGLRVERQVKLPVRYRGRDLEADLRVDCLVEDVLVLELKSVEALLPIHEAQLLTYLKLTGRRLGLLINFNVPLIKEGIRRLAL